MEFIDGLTKRQKNFITLFAALFNIRNTKGELKKFIPLPFQQEFLADSILCRDNPPNRIVHKGRGIGMTATVAGELLLVATAFPKVKIPVASISAKTANVLLNWCIDLADTANTDIVWQGQEIQIQRDTSIESVVRLENGSEIIPIAGGSPESIRSLRAPVIVLDEFAFNEHQKEILTAGERCLSEGGQMTIISTPKTADPVHDEFWRILTHADDVGYKKYEFPVFRDFDINKSVFDHPEPPIAPWLDLKRLEEARLRDPIAFERENLCRVSDESVAFLSLELIRSCASLSPDGIPVPKNGVTRCGIDVGRFHDLTAIEIFSEYNDQYYHVDEVILRNTSIPDQANVIRDLDEKYNFDVINIDATGMGLGLAEYLKEDLGSKVVAHTFTKSFKTKIATQMRNKMQDGRVYLRRDQKLMDDLHSVQYGSLDAPRGKDGHSDRFWSCALALYDEGTLEWDGEIPIFGGRISGG